jgi:hypothetical protein
MKMSKFQIDSKKQIWKENRVEMRVQIMADVIPISIAFIPSMLHQNNIGVTYAGLSHFKMEPIKFVPLYYMVMP